MIKVSTILRSACLAMFCGWMAWRGVGQAQTTPTTFVYDNQVSGIEAPKVFYGPGEYGDEVTLRNKEPWKVSDFTFDYFGDFTAKLGVTAVVSFYKNDGPDIDPGARTILSPSTLLYQSDPILLKPGDHEAVLSGLAIDVPSNFTWTVQIAGLSGVAGDRVGLQLNNPPKIGQSFDDFWRKLEAGNWLLFQIPGEVANFSSRIRAFAAPIGFPVLENLTTLTGTPTPVVRYTLSSILPDPGPLTVTAKSDNETLVPSTGILLGGSGLNQTIQIIPAPGQAGLATIQLQLKTDSGLTASTSFRIRVTSTTSPVQFSIIPDQKVGVGQPTGVIPFEITGLKDEGGLAGAKVVSSNKDLVPDANVVVGGDFGLFKLNVQVFPRAGKSGETTVTLEVTAGSGAKGSTQFKVTVGESTPPPPPPPALPVVTLSLVRHGAEPSQNAQFAIAAKGQWAAAGLVVRYGVTGTALAGSDYVTLSGSITLPAPVGGDISRIEIPVQVLDDAVVESAESVIITLTPSSEFKVDGSSAIALEIKDNDVPATSEVLKITQQPQSTSAPLGGEATFEVAASGNEPLTFQWRFGSFPLADDAGLGVKGATSRKLVLNPVQEFHAGKFSVVVTDRTGSLTSESASLVIDRPNRKPELKREIPNQTTTEGQAFRFELNRGTFDDPDPGDVLAWSVAGLPTWLKFKASERILEGTPSRDDVGTFSLRVVVTDRGGLVAETTLVVTVLSGRSVEEAFVQSMYRQVLGRFPSAEELSVATDLLKVGSTRESIATALVRGTEHSRVWITRLFVRLMHRFPMDSEVVSFQATLPAPADEDSLVPRIVLSEGYRRLAGEGTEAWISRLFQDFQGRSPSATELVDWTQASASDSRGWIRTFLSGAEVRRREVSLLFFQYVRRQPTSEELDSYAANLKGSDPWHQLRISLISSPQFLRLAESLPLNTAPVPVPGTATVRAGGTVALHLGGSDPDGDAVEFVISTNPEQGRLSGQPPFVTYLAKEGFVGTDGFEFVLKDGVATSAPAKIQILVVAAASSPVLSEVPNITVRRGELIPAISVKVTDADTPVSKITLSATSSDTRMFPPGSIRLTPTRDGASMSLSPLRGGVEIGKPVTIVLNATDDANLSTSTSFSVTVVEAAKPPVIDGPNLVNIEVGKPGELLRIKAMDPDTPSSELKLSVDSSNPELIPISRVEIGGENGDWAVVILPPRSEGSAFLTFIVSDGEHSTSHTLLVQVAPAPPRISKHPESKTVKLQEKVEFFVEATGDSLQFQWYFMGKAIPGAVARSFAIGAVTSAGQGVYHVVVSNRGGRVTSSEALLNVLQPPSIVKDPESRTVDEGRRVRFSVRATGDAPIQYQWLKESSPIEGQTRSDLNLDAVRPEDAGQYECRVTDQNGMSSLSKPAILKVVPALKFIAQPHGVAIPAGGRIPLSAKIEGAEVPVFQWFKNLVPIPGADRSEFEIASARIEDSGSYTVTVRDGSRAISSLAAVCRIEAPALQFSESFEGRLVFGGDRGIGRSTAGRASAEAGEPPGPPATVWGEWTAPRSGIVTLSTAGSELPTTLDLFEGATLAELRLLGSDKHAAGFGNGQVSLRVAAGDQIKVRVGTIARSAEESIVIGWALNSEAAPPLVLNQKNSSQILPILGTNPLRFGRVTIAVEAMNLSGPDSELTFQWMRGFPFLGKPIENAVRPTLEVDSPGFYYCEVSNRFGRTSSGQWSVVAVLGENLRPAFGGRIENPRAAFLRQEFTDGPDAGAKPEESLVSTMVMDTSGAGREPGEPVHCGVAGGASIWFEYRAPRSGRLIVSTSGSDFDTVLAAYGGSPIPWSSLAELECDNNSGGDAKTSLIELGVEAGKSYWIAADGVAGTTGLLYLTYQLVPNFDIVPVSNQTLAADTVAAEVKVQLVGVGDVPVTLRAVSGDANILPDSGIRVEGSGENWTLKLQPAAGVSGSVRVTLVGTSGQRVALSEFQFVVPSQNAPPKIEPVPDQAVLPGADIRSLNVVVTDDRTAIESLEMTASVDKEALLVPGSLGVVRSGASVQLRMLISPLAEGSGRITVRVRDSAGASSEESFAIHVLPLRGAPVIRSQPLGQAVTAGGPVRFEVVAVGPGRLDYQWHFRGLPVAGGTNATLLVQQAGADTAGHYAVVIRNASGAVTSDTVELLVAEEVRQVESRLIGTFQSGVFVLQADELPSGNYRLEASNDLERWTEIGRYLVEFGFIVVGDGESKEQSRRFYRLTKLP